jgi:hypothetical protein
MKIVQTIVQCPQCRGTRRDYSPKHHQQVYCDLCQGNGWIPLATCQSCGRPGFKLWPPNQKPIVSYCGLELCLTALVTIHKSSGQTTKVSGPAGRYVPMCELLPVDEDDIERTIAFL